MLFERVAHRSEGLWWARYKAKYGVKWIFNEIYKNREMFKKCLLLSDKNGNYDNIYSLISIYCGKKEIDYLYIGCKKDMTGYLQVWCNVCKHGIYISRIGILKKAKMVEMDDKTIDFDSLVPSYT